MRTVSSREDKVETSQSMQITVALAPKDHTLIYRIVGFYEYIQALHHFELLVRNTTSEERDTINEIISQHEEFVVYTNLSRRVQSPESTLNEVQISGDDPFAKRGLPWIMALARVEIGAMLAAHTNVLSPFEVVQPSRFEMQAYKEMLEDGMRTHYWALAGDKAFLRVIGESRKNPNAETVAYVRRLTLALEFHEAASRIGAGRLSPQQQLELRQWQQNMSNSKELLVDNIQKFLGSMSVSNQSVSQVARKQIGRARACTAQLRAERRELNTGKAYVTTSKPGG